jgi:hypothetical protein
VRHKLYRVGPFTHEIKVGDVVQTLVGGTAEVTRICPPIMCNLGIHRQGTVILKRCGYIVYWAPMMIYAEWRGFPDEENANEKGSDPAKEVDLDPLSNDQASDPLKGEEV